MNLSGKIALVTGASSGIGRGIAIELSKAGASVILNYNKNLQGAEETKKLIEEAGGYAYIAKADVSSYAAVKEMVDEIIKKFGKIDVLVNNAGISKVGLFIDMTEEDFNSIMDTNLKGLFNCSHNVAPHMLAKKSGSIINISSIWGNVGASCEVIYSASKGGINSFTKALAKELAPSNIRVNAIAPGVINTNMNQWLTKEEKESLKQEIPMLRLGESEDIGALVRFLAQEESKYITGQIISVDGGML
jgi:3-oxoacyl-[acyl-carrier protein] reductase